MLIESKMLKKYGPARIPRTYQGEIGPVGPVLGISCINRIRGLILKVDPMKSQPIRNLELFRALDPLPLQRAELTTAEVALIGFEGVKVEPRNVVLQVQKP